MRRRRTLKPQDRAPWRWITLDAGAVIVTDATKGFHFYVPLTENCTLQPPDNGTDGQSILYRIEQPASGKTVTIHSDFRQRGTVSVSTTASSVTYLRAYYSSDAPAGWDLVLDRVLTASSAYTITGDSTSRTFDPTTVTLAELGHVVATLIRDEAAGKYPVIP